MNILNYQGLLTDEDRKQILQHGCEYFTFTTCLDLSEPIRMTQYGNSGEVSLQNYSRDIASFMCWWSRCVHKDLNGFSGLHNVEFELLDCEIV